jgi:hypothetical protein
MMKEFKINPINICGGRRYEYLPPHIKTIDFDLNSSPLFSSRMKILDWVDSNLKGRYFFGSTTKLINNQIVICQSIGFEDPYETTLFLLGCPHMAKTTTPLT